MDLSTVSTYHAGILQSKAHRSLKNLVNGLLEKYDLTMLQWFILGLVHDAGKKGIRISDIAQQLDTTLAFVTNHINLLETRQLVHRSVDESDTRVRIVVLAPGSKAKVEAIEKDLRKVMRSAIYDAIDPKEFSVYIKVMTQLAMVDKD